MGGVRGEYEGGRGGGSLILEQTDTISVAVIDWAQILHLSLTHPPTSPLSLPAPLRLFLCPLANTRSTPPSLPPSLGPTMSNTNVAAH